MKQQIIKSFFSFLPIIILSGIIIIFTYSCQKRIIQNPGKIIVITGSNIIYSDVNPDSVILQSATDSFCLDVNNDGINDFVFHRSLSTSECRSGTEGEKFGFRIYLSVTPASGTNAIMTSEPNVALALDADSAATIGPDSLWATTAEVLLEGAEISTCNSVLGHAGYWLNVSDKYLGLKFIINNITHYGWARLLSTYSPGATSYLINGGQLILKDYAYNIIPNQPILAGQTK